MNLEESIDEVTRLLDDSLNFSVTFAVPPLWNALYKEHQKFSV